MVEASLSAVGVRRFANEAIRDAAYVVAESPAATFQFLCECGDLRCDGLVTLTVAQFERSEPGSVLAH
jgi:hypothetical protein